MSSLTPRIDRLEKNYLINGNFDFWQRATSYTFGANSAYGAADRWNLGYNGGGAPVFARSLVVPNSNSKYSIGFTSAAAANNCIIRQRIESLVATPLANRTVTVSGWFRVVNGDAMSIILSMATPTVQDNYASTANITVPNATQAISSFDGAWEFKSWTVTLPSAANLGLQITLTSSTNFSAASQTFNFSQIQVTVGEDAPSEYSLFGGNLQAELTACQRYFASYVNRIGFCLFDDNGPYPSQNIGGCNFNAMRTVPTILSILGNLVVGHHSVLPSSSTVYAEGFTCIWTASGFRTLTNTTAIFTFNCDAEL